MLYYYNIIMKNPFALTIFLNVLLVWHGSLKAEVENYKADICVYGGTASGVMAALAAEICAETAAALEAADAEKAAAATDDS